MIETINVAIAMKTKTKSIKNRRKIIDLQYEHRKLRKPRTCPAQQQENARYLKCLQLQREQIQNQWEPIAKY